VKSGGTELSKSGRNISKKIPKMSKSRRAKTRDVTRTKRTFGRKKVEKEWKKISEKVQTEWKKSADRVEKEWKKSGKKNANLAPLLIYKI
jgi:hypothetical protein